MKPFAVFFALVFVCFGVVMAQATSRRTAGNPGVTRAPEPTVLKGPQSNNNTPTTMQSGRSKTSHVASAVATKLVILTINSGVNPSANTPFSVDVQAQSDDGSPADVQLPTTVTLTLLYGSGSLGGLLSADITTGTHDATIWGVTYDKAESGVSIAATASGGDELIAGISSTFTVESAADHLEFVNFPAGGQVNYAIPLFTVEARRPDNSVDPNYTSNVTIVKKTGSGSVNGTLIQAITWGVAVFNDISFDQADVYSLTASAERVTDGTSPSIPILSASLPMVEGFEYSSGTTLTANGWNVDTDAGSNSITVEGSNLGYSSYESNGDSGAISMTTSGEDVHRVLDAVSSGSVYVSFLAKVSAAGTGDFFLGFGMNPVSGYTGVVFAKDVSGSLYFGVAKNGTAAYTSGSYAYNTTHLIVMKYTFNGSSNDDVVGIYVDPVIPCSEPESFDAQGTTGDADIANIAAVQLRQGTEGYSPTLELDGIAVGTSWNSISLPVEMVSFSARANRLTTQLGWSTATETNNFGFEVERKGTTTSWSRVGFVAGAGTSSTLHNYSFVDNIGQAGTYGYRIKQIDKSGSFKYSSVMLVEVGTVAKVLSLGDNYPNPFNPATNIEFSVPTDGRVLLRVHNILGQEVATLFDGVATAGKLMKATFNASRLSSGVYFSRLEVGGNALVKRMMLVK